MKNLILFLTLLNINILNANTASGSIEILNHSGDDSGYYFSLKLFEDDNFYFYSIKPADTEEFYAKKKSFYDVYRSNAIMTFEYDLEKRFTEFTSKLDSVVYTEPKKYLRRWKKPTRSEGGYNVGDSVIKGGRFVSLIDDNKWSPQEAPSYWRLKDSVFYYLNYKKPTGAHDCYSKGFMVLYNGDVYESLIDGNIWSPDEYKQGWKYIHRGPIEHLDSSKLVDYSMPEPQTRTTAPTYSQPSGAHDAYKRGDVVSLNGTTYRSIIDANVWSPEVAQSYWEVLSSETRSTVREWKKPTGVHDCYHKGYKMLFNGKTYESLMNSNVWSPEELPSSWKVVE